MENNMKTKPPESSQELRQRAEEQYRLDCIDDEDGLPSVLPVGTLNLLHELRVHQIELEMQNEELHRSQEELDVSKSRYFDLYDLAPVGYMTISDKKIIREVNLAAANMLGVARKSLVREPISRILPREDQQIFYQHLKQCFEECTPQNWEMRLLRNDNSLFWAHLQATPAENGEFWIVLNDITERKGDAEELTNSEERYRQLFDMELDANFMIEWETNKLLDANFAGVGMYGYSKEEFKSLVATDLSAEPDQTEKAIRNCETKVPLRWHRRKDGTVFPVEITGNYFEYSLRGDKERFLEMGFDGYLSKPLETKEFIREMKRVLGRK
jgi:PAS domain S-box-containing protein